MTPEHTSYADKLRDPRWQRKRLEVMERDGWKCVSCRETEATLNVHHLRYSVTGNPWDIDAKYLSTLCEGCHKAESADRKRLMDSIEDTLVIGGWWVSDLWRLDVLLGEFYREHGQRAGAAFHDVIIAGVDVLEKADKPEVEQ
jgi:hypothetical protein